MAKAPAFQFYVKDWLSDPLLKMVSHQTKGIWIDLLCFLWDSPDRGQLSGSAEQFQKMLGCNAIEWGQFIEEVSVTKFANFQNDNGIVTIKNRRMFREEKNRKSGYLRVKRFRVKRKCNPPDNANETPASSSSSSLNNNKGKDQFDVTHEENPQKTNLKYYKNEIGNYVCQTCQKSFMQYKNLQDHFEEHGKGIIENITSSFPKPNS